MKPFTNFIKDFTSTEMISFNQVVEDIKTDELVGYKGQILSVKCASESFS